MAESTITSKGQTTVPADIRALVHAKPGTRLVWSVMPDGTIIVRAKSKSILDMAGMLRAPKGKRVSVVRYVVQDDSGQLAAARRLIERCVGAGHSLFVPVTVSLELEWVLRANFGYVKDDVLQVLSNLFSAAELVFESERALEVALQLYREGTADFADCLHIALATEAGEQPLWTFDKSAAKVVGAQLLRTR